jgi:ABC-type multidrug transport system fused ATPase/permease subunit
LLAHASRKQPVVLQTDMSTPAADARLAARGLRQLLGPAARRELAVLVVPIVVVGSMLETLSVGAIMPAIILLAQPHAANRYPLFESTLQSLGLQPGASHVMLGAGALVVIHAVKAAFLAFLAHRQYRFVFAVQLDLSHRLFSTYLGQPWLFHLQRNSAQLTRNLVNEVNLVALIGLQAMLTLLSESLVLACLGALLLTVEPVGALAFAALLAVASWGFHRLTHATTAHAGVARQFHEGLRLQDLQEGLAAVREIKLLGCEQEFAERYRVHSVGSAEAGRWLATLQQLPRLWLELVAVVSLALLVAALAGQGMAPALLLPVLGMFAAAGFRLMPSVQRLMNARQALHYARPAIEVLHAELALETTAHADSACLPLAPLRTRIEVNNVTYTYPGSPKPSLADTSLAVARGEWVAVVGASGSAKSTLVHIVLGLLTPDHGHVRVDGTDIRNARRAWQDQVGFVPQSTCLIDDTVRRNIAFGVPDDRIDTEAVWRVLHAVRLAEFVRDLPEGLDTPLGERGVRLSGGQVQRIGLARALYRDPAVLVLDEPTSALDVATERQVLESIRAHGPRTVLLVAHRPSTVAHCDRIYTLEHGRVVHTQPASA